MNLVSGVDSCVNAVTEFSAQNELESIAAEARKELASAEARMSALLERAHRTAASAAKDKAELQRFLEEFGLDSAMHQVAAVGKPGTGPLFDVQAMRQGAQDLSREVARSAALETNLGVAVQMLQAAIEQVGPDQIFRPVGDTADLRLQQAMNSAREEERRRLAREIHDGPAQVLSNAIFAVHTTEQIAKRAPQQVGEELAQLRELLKDGVAEIRRFMFDLRPTMLQDLGLGPTLARYVDDYSRFFAKKVSLQCDEILPPLNADQELTIFRIVQEALQNVHKHAGVGAEAVVELRVSGNALLLSVTDSGKGFDPNSVVPRPGHGGGLPGMRERASLVGGEMTISSGQEGTSVLLRMPLRGQTGPLQA